MPSPRARLAANEALLRARVAQLWQTRLLRYSKLTVADEIENAVLLRSHLPARDPAIYADLERELGQYPVHQLLAHGQWIGGDRDGNPNVTAEPCNGPEPPVRRGAAPLPDRGALPGRRAVAVGPPGAGVAEMEAWPSARPTPANTAWTSPTAARSPASTRAWPPSLKDLTGGGEGRAPCRGAAQTLRQRRGSGRSARDRASLKSTTAKRWRRAPAPADPRRAVFGFHLATVDLRQSSDKHEEVVAELLAKARIEPNYAGLQEAAKRALLIKLLNDARRCAWWRRVFGPRPGELGHFRTAR